MLSYLLVLPLFLTKKFYSAMLLLFSNASEDFRLSYGMFFLDHCLLFTRLITHYPGRFTRRHIQDKVERPLEDRQRALRKPLNHQGRFANSKHFDPLWTKAGGVRFYFVNVQ